jgi:hypothetical protein
MDSEIKDAPSFTGLLQSVSKLIAWVGASAGAIGLVLTVFGYLVEHAYLDRLGVPRSYYEAKPIEYITVGGKFLMGVIQLSFIGVPQFLIRFWWLALILLATAAVAWRWRWPEQWRWLTAAGFMFIWLSLALPKFDNGLSQREAYAMVAAFTAITAVGIVYSFVELSISRPATSWRLYTPRVPFFLLLSASILALPYLRGAYATERNNPTVEFIGKDHSYFCEIAGDTSEACASQSWQLIEAGKDRAILRHSTDHKIYVVPAAALNTFRIAGKESAQ